MSDVTCSVAERWLAVPFLGCEGYEVSDLGRVRSWKRYRGKPGPRILTNSLTDKGYAKVGLSRSDGKVRSFTVHRLVMVAFTGDRPECEEVRHLDGNKLNNALVNLVYGTASENTFDTVTHGTHPMARKTHCKHGHQFTPENTKRKANGGRDCVICRRDIDHRYKLKVKLQQQSDAA